MQTTTKKLYEISEVHSQGLIPMSLGGLYKAIKEKKIPSQKIGKRIFIPSWFIDELTNKPADGDHS